MDRRLSSGRRRRDQKEEKAAEWLAQAHQINAKRKALTKDRDMAVNSMRGELQRCVDPWGTRKIQPAFAMVLPLELPICTIQ